MEDEADLRAQPLPLVVLEVEARLRDVTREQLDPPLVDGGRRLARRLHHARLDERDHARVRIVGEQAPHEAAADEAREPGDERDAQQGVRSCIRA